MQWSLNLLGQVVTKNNGRRGQFDQHFDDQAEYLHPYTPCPSNWMIKDLCKCLYL